MKKYGNFRWRVFGAIVLVNSSILSFPQNGDLSEYSSYRSPESYADFASQAASSFPLRPILASRVAELANRPAEEDQGILSPQPVRALSPVALQYPSGSTVPWNEYISPPVARTCSGFGYKKSLSPGGIELASIRRVVSMPSFTRR